VGKATESDKGLEWDSSMSKAILRAASSVRDPVRDPVSRGPRLLTALPVLLAFLFAGCGEKTKQQDPGAGAPPPVKVEREADASIVKVDKPEQFALATAAGYNASTELAVTGTVSPDVSRSVPVPSLVSGRAVEVLARLGDEVKKGQVLLKVRSSDVAGAYSDYRKAVVTERLTLMQAERAKLLFEKGALAKKDLEVAENAEDAAKVDLETTAERLRLLGSDLDHPTGIVEVLAPATGVITDQQVTAGSGVQALSAPNPFTISDLSRVWIVCDVYENNLPDIRMGEAAEIGLSAYPGKILRGRISNVSPILDPNLHTAKVRIEVDNPGRLLRVGMFVTATFHGQTPQKHASVPASAILHLHDRDWVYVPAGAGQFRRIGVVGGKTLPGNLQEIVSGLEPGAKVVANALVLQNTVDQ
jgi:cobalt-zinc-cadmium efflux system membrane fusion protein